MSKDSALKTVSANLGIPPLWIDKLIRFESGWNPLAQNPYSGARGLIQFMPDTAKSMGYDDADDLVSQYPDVESQLLGPVSAYLSKLKPFPTAQSLYMSVFYPVARTWPVTRTFPPDVLRVNPGIVTVGDYIKRVEGSHLERDLMLIAMIGTVIYLAYDYYKHHKKELNLWPKRKQIELV